MKSERTKVYTYTRVSTAMQIDGYSLDAQKARMKAFADFNGYEIVREYEDAGKSGRSIEGRLQFQQMMQDRELQTSGQFTGTDRSLFVWLNIFFLDRFNGCCLFQQPQPIQGAEDHQEEDHARAEQQGVPGRLKI